MPIKLITLLSISYLSCMITTAQVTKSDTSLNNITDVSKEFEEVFYEALSYRLINRNNKSIELLEKCLKLDDSKPIIYYEIGCNYYNIKEYDKALNNYIRANELMSNNPTILNELHKTYFELKNFDAQITTLKKLVKIAPNKLFTLAKSYLYTKQYKEALNTLYIYRESFGNEPKVERLYQKILKNTTDLDLKIDTYKARIKEHPLDERTYQGLHELYIKKELNQKAKETIDKLHENIPTACYLDYIKLDKYINTKNTKALTELMNLLKNKPCNDEGLKSIMIDRYTQYLEEDKDSLKASIPLEINDDLKELMDAISSDLSTKSLSIYEKNLEKDPNNYELIKSVVLLQLYHHKDKSVEKTVEMGLEKFPSQPFLYLVKGNLHIQENKYNEALIYLKDGLDYVIDNPKLEQIFYKKLAKTYSFTGDTNNANKYHNKSNDIKIQ